ncbi:LIVCS family branched-chain amino acid:cation transporter [Chryseobacterium defluvii]|uniref:LIVCS family branched-chain amino acid:cation transporter n=1 Tax=Chryseobacterium defluvii TaxID=160396 RepID=A0A840KN14_9FLAO|nr:hypothetical protein [Chryseobacterium defluvii]MBB4808222.1 LIVCS family branched-chain amino acid:cation transporter [Chryseobacterium defluvii]
MKDSTIMHIGKFTFGISFLLGNICFFGFFLGRIYEFAILGALLLVYGGILNALIFFYLLIYGSYHETQFKVCFRSAVIILINIPVIFLYSLLIGL